MGAFSLQNILENVSKYDIIYKRGENMIIKIILILVSAVLIISVLLQESKSDGLSGVISGGAEKLFGKKKSHGYDDMLNKITIGSSVLAIILIVFMLVRGA